MTLEKYNKLQIQRICNFAGTCHDKPDNIANLWVDMYSKQFSEKIKKLGINVEN